MGKFKLHKHFVLSFVGPDWKDCFINFEDLTMDELKELLQLEPPDVKNKSAMKAEYERTIKFIADHLIDGKGIGSDGKTVDITKDDVKDLSANIVRGAMTFLAEG